MADAIVSVYDYGYSYSAASHFRPGLSDWRLMRERCVYAIASGRLADYISNSFSGRDGSACLGFYAAMRRFNVIGPETPVSHELTIYNRMNETLRLRVNEYGQSFYGHASAIGNFRLGEQTLAAIDRKIAALEEHEVPASQPVEPTKSIEEGELACV